MFLLCILFLQSVVCYDVSTNTSENSDIFETSKNTNEAHENNSRTETNITAAMERITQPSQTQQIERTLAPTKVNGSLKVTSKKENNFENFRPSPQLETYYEYNKFPVKPAVGEAKTFGGFGEEGYFRNGWTERPLVPPWAEKQASRWLEGQRKPHSWNEYPRTESNPWIDKPTTQETWVSRVKFPTTSHGTTNERPYKFTTNDENAPNYPQGNFPATTEGFSFNRPVEVPVRNTKPKPVSIWDKFLGPSPNQKKSPQPIQKTFYDYNLLEKPPLHSLSKGPEHGLSEPNPWHKIIKILTTIIPIGLLISALTPTVITVTPMNDTQSRYRAEELHQNAANRLATSLNLINKLNDNNCRDRVLCELLISASKSKDSEQHIENLLSTFAENEDLKSKKEDLLKVFDAVKNGDCSPIICKNTKHPT